MPFPEEFINRSKSRLGEDYVAFLDALEEEPPVSVRTHPLKPKPASLPYQGAVPWSSNGFYLDHRPLFTLDPSFHAGAYYVQEASSMFLEQFIAPVVKEMPSPVILDLCAAPGGKSTHLAALMDHDGLLVANEVVRSRVPVLEENLKKWGYSNVVITTNDPADFQSLPFLFDVIYVDAPCSGEGLFRRDPDAMKVWSPQLVSLCAQRQQRILHDIWPCLKEDGYLIYSTCTFNELENEENLRWLNERHDVEFVTLDTSAWLGIETAGFGQITGYRFSPPRVRGEGFFISMMKKKSKPSSKSARRYKPFTIVSGRHLDLIQDWLRMPAAHTAIRHEDSLLIIPDIAIDLLPHVKAELRLVSAGTTVATVKQNKEIPHHELAMSCHIKQETFPVWHIGTQDALRYLRKETLEVAGKASGLTLMVFEAWPLGWANVLPTRMNNLYPISWRIRMKTG